MYEVQSYLSVCDLAGNEDWAEVKRVTESSGRSNPADLASKKEECTCINAALKSLQTAMGKIHAETKRAKRKGQQCNFDRVFRGAGTGAAAKKDMLIKVLKESLIPCVPKKIKGKKGKEKDAQVRLSCTSHIRVYKMLLSFIIIHLTSPPPRSLSLSPPFSLSSSRKTS